MILWLMAAFLAALLDSPLLAQPVTAYVRRPDGQWLKQPAQASPQNLTLQIGKEALSSGGTIVVLQKPSWMTLQDTKPPQLIGLQLNRHPLALADCGENNSYDLGVLSQEPAEIVLNFRDNANPLNPHSVQLRGLPDSGTRPLLLKGFGPPQRSGQILLRLPPLTPREYKLRLQLADLSPYANTLVLGLQFRVIGFVISEDQQMIRLGTPGGAFLFRAQRLGELQVGDTTPAYLSTGMSGGYFYIDRIDQIKILEDTPQTKRLLVLASPGKTDRGEEGRRYARLEYELMIRADLPCLLVTSRTINLAEKQEIYSWWGWLPGRQWIDSHGEHNWAGQYRDIGHVGWIFLPQEDTETPGIGWISPHFFGESRFNTMLLYTDPRQIVTNTNETVELRFALMPARNAAEVATVAEKIRALGLF